jgi:hypothetical protein
MKKQLALLFLLLCCFSCASQKKEVVSKSTIKLEGTKTNIRSLLEIDGYYAWPNCPYNNGDMFFEDGTWVSFYFRRDKNTDQILPENEKKANMSKSVQTWIVDGQVRWGTYWGVYKISGDTLVLYHYDKGHFWKGWALRESRFKIIDKTTILLIYGKELLKTHEQYYKSINFNPWIKNGDKLYFNSADSLPASDCWLKEEKWIWRNEQDWKAYMERIKQIKKQYKKK